MLNDSGFAMTPNVSTYMMDRKSILQPCDAALALGASMSSCVFEGCGLCATLPNQTQAMKIT